MTGASRKLKKLVKKFKPKRAGYFGLALLVVFSLIIYDLVIKPAPEVRAASTVGTSSLATASGNTYQRHMLVSSTGTMLAFYDSGGQSPSGLVYSKSTDSGVTWGSPVLVDSGSAGTNDFSVTIDGNNNIYVAINSTDSNTSGIYLIKLTYASGSWSVGARQTVVESPICIANGGSGVTYSKPTIAITSSGTVWVGLDSVSANDIGTGCLTIFSATTTYSSSDLSTWASHSLSLSSAFPLPLVAVGKAIFAVWGASGDLYTDLNESGTLTKIGSLGGNSNTVSMSYGLDQIHFLYSATGIQYRTYDIAAGTLSSATTISSSTNDVVGKILTDSNSVWAVFQQYVGANSYNIVYKKFNGTSWDASPTNITTDNLNNTTLNAPGRVGNSSNIPVIWTTGTASPYTIKASTFSSTGTVTDTGNQAGFHTGTLTGNSGDVIVKCGTWYYNTVNIVAGMTIKVCPSNGQTGGRLTIYANTVTVSGLIDGSGRGMPGGVNIAGTGGAGGAAGVAPSPPGAGGLGDSTAGGPGSGDYGGTGGSAGNSAAPGGAAGSALDSTRSGAGGGGGNVGLLSSGGSASAGGYLLAGVNGDLSTDSSVVAGSGGGAGGTGGSGAGGGGGLSGQATAPNCPGAGGQGGKGGNGGQGGKGGNGGAAVYIYASSVTVSGNINTTGQSGSAGGGASAGATGLGGGVGFLNCSV